MKNHLIALGVGIALVIAFIVLFNQKPKEEPFLSSVSVTNEYLATSTAASVVYGATITGSQIIKTGQGSLGQVVITGANTGVVNFYNATTTNVSSRTGQPATSTILIASLPASLAAGTYVFDAFYTAGLYIELVGGAMPTSTISYR